VVFGFTFVPNQIARSAVGASSDQTLYTLSSSGGMYLVITRVWTSATGGRSYIQVSNTASPVVDADSGADTSLALIACESGTSVSALIKIAVTPGTVVTLKISAGTSSGGFEGYLSPVINAFVGIGPTSNSTGA
jgi:hypothetical protein